MAALQNQGSSANELLGDPACKADVSTPPDFHAEDATGGSLPSAFRSCCRCLSPGLRKSDLSALERRQKAAEWTNVFSDSEGMTTCSEGVSAASDADAIFEDDLAALELDQRHAEQTQQQSGAERSSSTPVRTSSSTRLAEQPLVQAAT